MDGMPQDPGWDAHQQRMDQENIRTLAILHRIYGAFLALGSCCVMGYFSLVFGFFGLGISSMAAKDRDVAPFALAIIGGIWGFILLILLTKCILNFLCAKWLEERRCFIGVTITSALNCLNIPLGTALGVFTLVVVNRQSVKPTFH